VAVGNVNNAASKRMLAFIMAAVGLLAIIAAVLYVAGTANSLHIMVGSVHRGHHAVRAAICLVVGLALLVGAWAILRPAPAKRAP
jgi:uncharacterized RDD family membrane protein YckC